MTSLKTKIISRLKFIPSNPLHNYFLKEPIYIFHHIPKCGGTSFMYGLRALFYIVKDYKTTHLSKTISKPVDVDKLRHFQCLSGHFHVPGIYLHERYPKALTEKKFKVFTILRDPLQTKISLYYSQIRTNMQPKKMNLEEHLLYEPNWMAARFPCTQENYKEVLDRYFFIGILEQPQASLDKLVALMNKKLIKLPLENATERDQEELNISPEIIEEFKKLNYLDYLIYDYGKELYLNKFSKE